VSTKDQAQEAILRVVASLDAIKAAALGRKAPKTPKGHELTEQCVQMVKHLGLIERAGQVLTLTARGSLVQRCEPPQACDRPQPRGRRP